MNKNFREVLYKWPRPYISGVDLQAILCKSPDSRYSIVKRAIKEGLLTPIKKDLYLNKSSGKVIDSFEISTIIYGPSYVSFESALSYHQWIPEGVRTTTCATIKRGVEFETCIGVFSYEHIPTKSFFLGVEQNKQDKSILFIANPWKAIADIIYSRKRSWKSIEALSEDLRIEPESMVLSDKQLLEELIENYASPRVRTALSVFRNF